MEHPPRMFEDFLPGHAFTSKSRSISRGDIKAFTGLSGDRTALHTDEAYAASTPLGGIVAHGALVLAAATGLAYELGIFEGTVLAVRSMEIAFDRPVRPGDAVRLTLTVVDVDPRPRPDRGLIRFSVNLTNDAGRTVMSGLWALLLRRARSAGPN